MASGEDFLDELAELGGIPQPTTLLDEYVLWEQALVSDAPAPAATLDLTGDTPVIDLREQRDPAEIAEEIRASDLGPALDDIEAERDAAIIAFAGSELVTEAVEAEKDTAPKKHFNKLRRGGITEFRQKVGDPAESNDNQPADTQEPSDFLDQPTDGEAKHAPKKQRFLDRFRSKTSDEYLYKKERRHRAGRIGALVAGAALIVSGVVYAFNGSGDQPAGVGSNQNLQPTTSATSFSESVWGSTTTSTLAPETTVTVSLPETSTPSPTASLIPPIVQERGGEQQERTDESVSMTSIAENARLTQTVMNKLASFTPEDDAAFAEMEKWCNEHPDVAFILKA